MKCKDCKYWSEMPSPWETDGKEGRYCSSDKLREESPHEPDALVYSYFEGGRFWTGPEFGCVHHEPKA